MELIKISEIQLNKGQITGLPKNPRFIKDERFERLVKSIQDDPEMLELREIIVIPHENKYVVICGNMRLKACQELGLLEVPCKIIDKDTPPEKLRAYAIKDNVAFGSDDFEALSLDWDSVELENFGVELPEFESETDYSEKNKEIDTNDFSDKMEMKFEFSSEEYQFIQSQLSKIDASKELALLKLLNYVA